MTNSVEYRKANHILISEMEMGFRPVMQKTVHIEWPNKLAASFKPFIPEWWDYDNLEWWKLEMAPEFENCK